MKIIRSAGAEPPLNGSVATLGIFDGVHLGHRKILSEVVDEGRKSGLPAVAVTFHPHPSWILTKKPAGLIIDEKEKLGLFKSCGIDVCMIIEFDGEFAGKPPEEFVENTLEGFLGARSIVVGFNYVFGAGRRGDARLLSSLGEKHGFSLKLIPPVKIGEETVSSSIIRRFISEGDIEKANLFLGRSFSIGGAVIKGEERGSALGFPTANIALPAGRVVPAPGVYSGKCLFGKESRPAVLYTGNKPTFAPPAAKPSIEVHIIGFSGDLYGREITFNFEKRLRGDIKFKNVEVLKRSIEADVNTALELQ